MVFQQQVAAEILDSIAEGNKVQLAKPGGGHHLLVTLGKLKEGGEVTRKVMAKLTKTLNLSRRSREKMLKVLRQNKVKVEQYLRDELVNMDRYVNDWYECVDVEVEELVEVKEKKGKGATTEDLQTSGQAPAEVPDKAGPSGVVKVPGRGRGKGRGRGRGRGGGRGRGRGPECYGLCHDHAAPAGAYI